MRRIRPRAQNADPAPKRQNRQGDRRVNRWLWIAGGTELLALVIDQPLLLGLGILLALAAGCAYLWWRFGLSGVHYQRRLSTTHATFGEEIELELTVENAKPLPLVWLDLQDQFPDALPVHGVTLEASTVPKRATFRTLFNVRPYERVRRHYHLTAAARGWYRFGPAILKTGDPFGLITCSEEIEGSTELIVFPEIRPVAAFGLPSELPLGEARPRRPLIEDPFTVEGTRPYLPGDHPRQINWRASARIGSLQSKRYEKRSTPSVMIVLDANTFEHFWEGFNLELLERAISVTASIASNLLTRGYSVGLIANAPPAGQARHLRIGASASRGQLPRVLEGLAKLVGGTGTRIERILAEESRSLPFGTTVVMVSPNVTEGLQQALLALSKRGIHPVLIVCGEKPELAIGLRGRVSAFHVPNEQEAADAFQPVALAV